MTYYKFYHYEPSLAAACIFTVVFGILTLWHCIKIIRQRTWFVIPVIVGGIFECGGYVARAISAGEKLSNLSLGPYVIQTLLILMAPPLFAATLYMTLGRVVTRLDSATLSLISPRWLTRLFVTFDVVCFMVQLGGAGIMASSKASTASTGAHIVLGGLVLQIAIFGFFVAIALVFHKRLRTSSGSRPGAMVDKTLYVLYIASGCILVRNLVRVAEFLEGFRGFIIDHEGFLYGLDAVPMAAVMLVIAVIELDWLSNRNMLAQKEATESGSKEQGV